MSAVSLSACDETESSSPPSSPTTSASSSSNSSSSPAEEAVSTTVNETEWNTALSPTAFVNFTAKGTDTERTEEYGNITTSFVSQFATNKLKITYTQGISDSVVYTAIENGNIYTYMDMLGNGNYMKIPTGESISSLPSVVYLSCAEELCPLANLYASFSYNAENRTYTASNIEISPTFFYENVKLKFEEGVLVSYSATTKQTEDGETKTFATEFTLSKYGTTSVTLPVIESEPSVKGDGIIAASEWASAFSASALENVKMSYTMTFSDSTDTMHIYFDDSSIVKINAKFSGYDDENIPYTIITDQYWIENSNQVYVSGIIGGEVIGWTTVSNDRNNHKTAQDCRESLYTFASFYQMFTFNGYEGTFDLGDGERFTVRFNEQEQLIYYSDGDMISISLSQYGQIHNQLPIEAQ